MPPPHQAALPVARPLAAAHAAAAGSAPAQLPWQPGGTAARPLGIPAHQSALHLPPHLRSNLHARPAQPAALVADLERAPGQQHHMAAAQPAAPAAARAAAPPAASARGATAAGAQPAVAVVAAPAGGSLAGDAPGDLADDQLCLVCTVSGIPSRPRRLGIGVL
jgi:hypothetical protein